MRLGCITSPSLFKQSVEYISRDQNCIGKLQSFTTGGRNNNFVDDVSLSVENAIDLQSLMMQLKVHEEKNGNNFE